MIEWDLLDELDSADCWTNALRGTPAHMDSYMTVPEYDRIDKVLDQEKNKYTSEQWKQMMDYYRYQSYISPNMGILAGIICRKFSLTE